ncbi:unnamed protein product [Oncorhynchus mykiss]|uniref:Uncharacterized protein n=1 Tax=Oncorhynchus mykiss TaxID=8022 RepID=A0A060Y537_ONCMY|nr:unnamed protein product [Oncorhynchus mykiss]
MKRARQNLFPLRRLTRFGMGPQILKRFYSCTIESMSDWLHHCLVRQLLGLRQQGTPESSVNGPLLGPSFLPSTNTNTNTTNTIFYPIHY